MNYQGPNIHNKNTQNVQWGAHNNKSCFARYLLSNKRNELTLNACIAIYLITTVIGRMLSGRYTLTLYYNYPVESCYRST